MLCRTLCHFLVSTCQIPASQERDASVRGPPPKSNPEFSADDTRRGRLRRITSVGTTADEAEFALLEEGNDNDDNNRKHLVDCAYLS
jgi:hypothetical protein